MEDFKQQLIQSGFTGETDDTDDTRQFYSHDASLFEIKPQLIVYPKNSADVQRLINVTSKLKQTHPDLSITARSAGTDMSGGAINESIIVDFNKYFTAIEEITASSGHAQPGVFYRDFEKATLEQGSLMPSYPASRELCTIGGMVANNSGGEKSLEFGKTENFVTELKVVLADGKEYTLKPLNRAELDAKRAQKDFEGQVYSQLFALLDSHYDQIKAAKPSVSKNSTGYNLWDVWDRETGVFDLTKLIVGSQGTLGFVTDIHLKLVPARPHSGLLVCFLKDIDRLGEIINVVLAQKPATFESFDDHTLWLSIKFMPYFAKTLGLWGLVKLMFSLIPDGFMLLKGIPKMILMVEFNGQSVDEVTSRIETMRTILKPYGMAMERDETEVKSKKFWIMRREAFNLLRKKVKDKHTAPFIDDLVVQPKYLPEFLPQLRNIVKKYNLLATIQGHIGDGNFHIIPLMKIEEQSERDKLLPAMKEVNELVLKYHGSLSGEHNDGLVRGPWLEQMYGPEILALFRQAKQILDPEAIFNPHKKANADWDYSFSHVREKF
ncbi:MAG TPA: FAD-binding oxidoreductase [Patescibacteria group bacterium]|jgi:FAD/FMN-containing dehydrogenase|nr:FAD-binding oxidoreductase [Patescibacteria group bacterium]